MDSSEKLRIIEEIEAVRQEIAELDLSESARLRKLIQKKGRLLTELNS